MHFSNHKYIVQHFKRCV